MMSDPIQKSDRPALTVMPPTPFGPPLANPAFTGLHRLPPPAWRPAGPWLEQAAGFGQWRHARGRLQLSAHAAALLDCTDCPEGRPDECLARVVAEDLLPLLPRFVRRDAAAWHCELRVISASQGLRWLRLSALPAAGDGSDTGVQQGIVQDVTELRHAQMRERLGFELTEFLIGSHTLGHAILNVIRLVCNSLGWDWGAYWALEHTPEGRQQLACQQFWHPQEHDMRAFSQASQQLRLSPGEGLVGGVWQHGAASWVEDMAQDPRFVRRVSAGLSQLRSGFVFPVTYTGADGASHRPGVLEFYSRLARQPDAQLPQLASTIGALLAQTAQTLEQQATVLRLSQIDGLTGLANRRHFYELLAASCRQAEAEDRRFGLMFIDLDRFKPINDAFGHDAGNTVLREFAQRLLALAPPGACAGRLGGDEFALLLPGADLQAFAEVAEQVHQAAHRPMQHEGLELSLSASVGISLYPENGRSPPELLRSADAAMYRIKHKGREGSDVFSQASPDALAEQRHQLMQRLRLAQDLQRALPRGELFLHHQPIFELASGRLHGTEALLRWRRPDGVLVPPDVFIPLAEEAHLIVPIGQWVAAQACRDLAALKAAGLGALTVHINMASPEFHRDTLPEELLALTRQHGLAPDQLELELTERLVMAQPEQVRSVMGRLREAGFGLSLDDFGQGHSALSLLRQLPLSTLKVDRGFVQALDRHAGDEAIVRSIIALGHQLGLRVIVEGVETAAQLDRVRACGARFVQGYVLARPLPLAELLQRWGPQPGR